MGWKWVKSVDTWVTVCLIIKFTVYLVHVHYLDGGTLCYLLAFQSWASHFSLETQASGSMTSTVLSRSLSQDGQEVGGRLHLKLVYGPSLSLFLSCFWPKTCNNLCSINLSYPGLQARSSTSQGAEYARHQPEYRYNCAAGVPFLSVTHIACSLHAYRCACALGMCK